MLYEGSSKFGRVVVGKEFAASLWRGIKQGVTIGAEKIWEAISSCFGSGWWRSDDSWSNEDSWLN